MRRTVAEGSVQRWTVVVDDQNAAELDSYSIIVRLHMSCAVISSSGPTTRYTEAQECPLTVGWLLEHDPVARGEGPINLHLRSDLQKLDFRLLGRVQALQGGGGLFMTIVQKKVTWRLRHERKE